MGLFGSTPEVDPRILAALHHSQQAKMPAKDIAKRQRPLLELLRGDSLHFAYLSRRPTTDLIGITDRLLVGVGWDSNFSKGGVKSFPFHTIAEFETRVASDGTFLVRITDDEAMPFKAYASQNGTSKAKDNYWAGTLTAGFGDRSALDDFEATLEAVRGRS